MQIVTGKRQVASRAKIMEAIRSGQYTMVVGGTEVTDFKKIDEALGSWPKSEKKAKGQSQLARLMVKFDSRCNFCRRQCDADSPTNRPMRDWLVNSEKNRNRFSNLVLSCFTCFTQRHPSSTPSPRFTTTVNIGDGREYRAQRLEHFGDAIILLAARLISHELLGNEQRLYCALASRLVSNQNLATYPGIKHPDQFEIIVGQEFITDGIEPALDKAKEMLRETKVFKETELQNEISR